MKLFQRDRGRVLFLQLPRRLTTAPCKRTQHCWPTTPNVVGCNILRPFAHHVACCCAKFETVKLFSQQLPTFLLFRDRRSVAQQCWIRLHSSSNIVGAAHAHYAWFTKTYGLYSSNDALQVPTLLGVVASVSTPLPTCTQQLPTLLAQQRWELLRPFARGLPHPNNVSIQIQSFRVDIRPMTPRNNFVFVSNRLPNLFARRPEMPLPLIPFSQESAPLKGNGTRKAFWEICPPFCPFCRLSS